MTTDQILSQILNIAGETQWIPVEGIFSLNEVLTNNGGSYPPSILSGHTGLLQPRHRVTFNPAKGLVTKAFINQRTGEVRTFLAKNIEDLPERSFL